MAEETKLLPKLRKGRSGTQLQAGQYSEEYLSTLLFSSNAYTIYDKMRRSDYQVSRVLRTLFAPIQSGLFEYKPKDPEDQAQVKQALFKNKFFNSWCIDKWGTTLYQMLSYLTFGFAVFEPYEHIVEDKDLGTVLVMKNIGWISPRTIENWEIKNGEVKAIHQVCYENEEYTEVWIDGKHLLVLTNQKEGDNYEGVSILRNIYGNYIRKDLYLRLDMIGNERMAVGTPVFFAPQQLLKDANELANLQTIAENYVAHESSYIILDDRFAGEKGNPKFFIQEGKYDSKSIQEAIQREDGKMMDSVLASFLDIGVYRAGGNSQNEGQMELFLNSLLFIAKYIAEVRDNLAHKYYVRNFGEPEIRLDTIISNITKDDAHKIMEVIRGYAQVDVIRPDERLEKEVRADLGLPEKDTKTERKNVFAPDKNTERTPEGEEKPQAKPSANPIKEK